MGCSCIVFSELLSISKLLNNNGDWCDQNSGLGNVVGSYFSNLFKSQCGEMDTFINCVDAYVTIEDDDMFEQRLRWKRQERLCLTWGQRNLLARMD